MSKQVDEKVLSMQFDNKQFEEGIKTSIDSLDRLQKTLKSSESSKCFRDLDLAAKSVDLSGLEKAVGSLSSRFSVMGIAGMTAIQTITNSILGSVANIGRKVSGMIVNGGISRAMNIEQAKFQLAGLKVAWEDIEDDIMFGVDKTAYGLDAAAIAASQLYASNVKLGDSIREIKDESTGEIRQLDSMAVALKAISGVAAMTNSDYQSIASIFTTVAGQGQLMTMQLRQLEGRGLNAAAKLGEVLNKSEAEVREMVTKGQIDFEMFSTAMYDAFGEHASEANKTLTGVVSNVKSALSKIGAKFVQPLLENEGPLVGMFDQLRLRLNDIKDNIDPIANIWTKFAKSFIKSKTDMLANMDVTTATKSFVNVIEGIANILNGLKPLLTAVKAAFREIFPKKENNDEILTITESFKKMTEGFEISNEVARKVKHGFMEFFDIFRASRDIIENTIDHFYRLYKMLSTISETGKLWDATPLENTVRGICFVIETLGNVILEALYIGTGIEKFNDLATNFEDAIVGIGEGIISFMQNNNMRSFPDMLSDITKPIKNFVQNIEGSKFVDVVKEVGNTIKGLVSNLGIDFSNVKENIEEVTGIIDPFSSVISVFAMIIGGAFEVVKSIAGGLAKIIENVCVAIKNGLTAIVQALNGGDYANAINNTMFAVVLYNLKNVVLQIRKLLLKSKPGELLKNITEPLDQLKDTLFEWEKSFKSDFFLKIATALLLFAVALTMISSLDTEQLVGSLSALTVMFVELCAALKFLSGLDVDKKVAGSINKMMKSVLTMSFALLMLATAVKKLGDMKPEELAKGLIGVTVLLGDLTAVMMIFSNKGGNKVIKGVGSLILMTVALRILVGAVKELGTLGIDQLVPGLIAVSALMLELAIFTQLVDNKRLINTGVGLIAISEAISILVGSVNQLGQIDGDKLVSGLIGIGAVLLELAIFTQLIENKKIINTGIGLIAVATAVKILASATKDFGSINVDDLAKAEIGIGALLIMLASFTKAISGSRMMTASVSMVMIGTSMLIFASAMKKFGEMDIESLVKAASALTIVLGAIGTFSIICGGPGIIIAAAGLLVIAAALAIITPQLLLLGKAATPDLVKSVTALSAAILLIGGMATIFGSFGPYMILGATGLLIMAAALTVLTPQLIMLSGVDGGNLAKSIFAVAGAFLLFGTIGALLGVVSPLLLAFGASLVVVGAGILAISGGLLIISTALTAIGVSVATGGASLMAGISNIIKQIADMIPYILSKLAEGLIAFLQMLVDSSDKLYDIITKLLTMILNVIANSVTKIVETVTTIIMAVLNAIKDMFPEFVDTGFTIILSILNGINDSIEEIVKVGIEIVANIIRGIGEGLPELIAAGYDLIIAFVNGIADTIDEKTPDLIEAMNRLGDSMLHALLLVITNGNEDFANAGVNLVKGFKDGIQNTISEAVEAVSRLGSKVLTTLKDKLGIHSPSREAMSIAGFFNEGFIYGLKKTIGGVEKEASNVGISAILALSKAADMVQNGIDVNPVIRPVIDLSDVESGAKSIGGLFNNRYELVTSAGSISAVMNSRSLGATNDDVVSAISGLRKDISNIQGNNYNINGITYDDGSNVASAIETLVRAARIERRS